MGRGSVARRDSRMKKAWRVDAAGMGEQGVRYYWWQKKHAQAFARPNGKDVERVAVVGSTTHVR
jgi:hypothetical protein